MIARCVWEEVASAELLEDLLRPLEIRTNNLHDLSAPPQTLQRVPHSPVTLNKALKDVNGG